MKLFFYNWAGILSVNLILQVSFVISSEWEMFVTKVLGGVA